MDTTLWVELAYLLSAVVFFVGLKRMQSPATARKGNGYAALAMLIAIVATLVDNQILNWSGILIGIIVGALIATGQEGPWASVLGFVALVFATINVVGGFAVTYRMLEMFQQKRK